VAEADLVLLGYGVDDSLQISVNAQRLLAATGRAYTLGVPANLARLLASQRVETVDLSDRFTLGRRFEDAYLDVAEFLLRRTTEERPVIFLTYGSPLFLNSLGRFLFVQARQRNLTVDVRPAISQFDQIVSDLGIDVGAGGLQLFDARRLLRKRQQLNPAVPLLLLQLAGVQATAVPDDGRPPEPGDYAEIADYLKAAFGEEQPVTLLNLAAGDRAATRTTVPLVRFAELVPQIVSTSHLFVEAARTAPPGKE